MLFATSQLAPPATLNPSGVWFFNWVIPIAGSVFIVLAIADAIRRRRLTWGFLFLFNSLAVYWMETIGDWGQMLFYSPAFAQHHLLEWLPIKTPNDPLFMPFAYAVYWGVHALLVLWLSQWVSARFGWSMLKSMVVLAIPVNYVWDFAVEGTATAMGWWTYDPGIGPVLEWGNGGRITLLWTIGIMCVWPNLIAYWAGKPPIRGLNHFERFCRLDRFTVPTDRVASARRHRKSRRDSRCHQAIGLDQAARIRRLPQLRGHDSAMAIRTHATGRLVHRLPDHLLCFSSHSARGVAHCDRRRKPLRSVIRKEPA